MSKKVTELLTKAKALNSADLADGIEALEFLGADATANNTEYKELKELVELVEAGAGDGEDKSVALTEEAVAEYSEEDCRGVLELHGVEVEEGLSVEGLREMVSKVVFVDGDALQAGLADAKAKQDVQDKADADAKAKQDAADKKAAAGKSEPKPDEEPPEEPAQTKPRKNYADIKMVGSQYFWTGDYSKGFSNADDCAVYRDEKQGK